MADYHPLIARAVEGLSDNTTELRQAVYERARSALQQQLRSLNPPLSDVDISREQRSLDQAIERVEREYGEPEPEAAVPALAAEAAPDYPAVTWHGDRGALPEAQPAGGLPSVAVGRPGFGQPADECEEAPAESGRDRPRIQTVAPTIGQANRGRTMVLAGALVAVIGSIAIAAWWLRDKPADLPRPEAATERARPPETDNKFADRVAGERAPGAAGPGPAQTPAPAPVPGTTPPRAEVGIAQRAILYEENPADPQTPRATAARAVWRLDAVNAGQGQPLETVVRATIDTSDGTLSLNLLLRRNLDAALPASHTVELAFTTPPNDPNRVVRDVGKLALKNEEGQPGAPLAGLQVPVTTNLFLFGLSNVPRDIERNTELLTKRNWLDLPIMFASGQRAVLSFEKGVPGENALNDAFRLW